MKNCVLQLAVFVLFLGACADKDAGSNGPRPPEYYRFHLGKAKDYLWAKPGSYWIYKNINTGAIDTLICTGLLYDSIVVTGTQDYSQHITVEYDKLSRTIQSSYHKKNYFDYTADQTADFNGYKDYKTKVTRQISGVGEVFIFFNPVVKDLIFGNGASNTKCLGIDSTYILQGKTYQLVAKFEIDIDGIWENSPPFTGSTYYWAKDVGLIKRSASNRNDNWELIEYNIIR